MKVPEASNSHNFIQGIKTMCGAGDPSMKNGIGMHVYTFNQNMGKTAFYNSDGDFLIVPQEGTLFITTEFGRLTVKPLEICVIQRGIKFKVDLDATGDELNADQRGQLKARGYICEAFMKHFIIPDLGPIGANCMANPMHFQIPTAWYEDSSATWAIQSKFGGKFF